MAPREAMITDLLRKLRAGDDEVARGELIDLVYSELHRIARGYVRKERSGHTLQATALVNEAYLRIFKGASIQFVDRAHFFALMSQTMRRVLVDHARARSAARRGSDGERVPIEDCTKLGMEHGDVDLLELDFALEALARQKAELARVVEMRYFGGMTAEEIAEVLGESVHVVRYELRLAHAWLRREMVRTV